MKEIFALVDKIAACKKAQEKEQLMIEFEEKVKSVCNGSKTPILLIKLNQLKERIKTTIPVQDNAVREKLVLIIKNNKEKIPNNTCLINPGSPDEQQVIF